MNIHGNTVTLTNKQRDRNNDANVERKYCGKHRLTDLRGDSQQDQHAYKLNENVLWSLGDEHGKDKKDKDDKKHSEYKARNKEQDKDHKKDAGPVELPLKKAKNVFNLMFFACFG